MSEFAVDVLVELAGRIAARRRPVTGPGEALYGEPQYVEWTVGHPIMCPYRLSFRAWREGGLSLVISDVQGNRLLPPIKSQSMAFTQEQHDQLGRILLASQGRPWWEV